MLQNEVSVTIAALHFQQINKYCIEFRISGYGNCSKIYGSLFANNKVSQNFIPECFDELID